MHVEAMNFNGIANLVAYEGVSLAIFQEARMRRWSKSREQARPEGKEA
jgi:hypothetical protein